MSESRERIRRFLLKFSLPMKFFSYAIAVVVILAIGLYVRSCMNHNGIVLGYDWLSGKKANLINYREKKINPEFLFNRELSSKQDPLPIYVPSGWKLFYAYETEIAEGKVFFWINESNFDFTDDPVHKNEISETSDEKVEVSVPSGWYDFYHRESMTMRQDGNFGYELKYWVVWGITPERKE